VSSEWCVPCALVSQLLAFASLNSVIFIVVSTVDALSEDEQSD